MMNYIDSREDRHPSWRVGRPIHQPRNLYGKVGGWVGWAGTYAFYMSAPSCLSSLCNIVNVKLHATSVGQ